MLTRLDTPPKGADSFIWTDFVELRALIHPDKCFSRGDLAGIEHRHRDLTGHGFNVETRWKQLADFAFIRQIEFDDSYPFEVSDDGDTIVCNFDASQKQLAYITLLIASCMRNIESARQGDFARLFELTCFQVFSKLMPEGSEIRATWANGGPEAPYIGTLYDKMQAIAKDLRCTPNFKARDFRTNDRGDGGIDLIAWHPMTDNRPGMPISFAQCGCSKDEWTFKQLEASPAKHYSHLPVMHPWATYYFLPLDLRHTDDGWAAESDIGQAIIVDRLRMTRLLEQYNLFASLPAMPCVQETIDYIYS
ncbi:hypothetical protein [Methylotenera sp. L2L1]|uniref:hypothetical protein n=1 Tax=Methylotenera sp. L2L1 TaxID=1502770 RepID=UPI00068A930D|nr:hypothetical protein [Methylotenera sp. L2L1]